MAEQATEIVRDNGDDDFSFRTQALQAIIDVEQGCQDPRYSEHLTKLLRDKPNLTLPEMLRELRLWMDQIDDLKLANRHTPGNKNANRVRPSAHLANEQMRAGAQPKCRFCESSGKWWGKIGLVS